MKGGREEEREVDREKGREFKHCNNRMSSPQVKRSTANYLPILNVLQ